MVRVISYRVFAITFLFGWIFQHTLLFSEQGYGVSVQTQSVLDIEAYPSQVVTFAFIVNNTSQYDETFIQRLKLPLGWQTIPVELYPFSLDAQGQSLQLVSIRIPEYALSDWYEFEYTVQGSEHPELISSTPIRVFVNPVVSIVSKVLKKPKFLIPGMLATVKLEIENRGNAPQSIDLEVMNRDHFAFEVPPMEDGLLMPGEKKEMAVRVQIPKTINRFYRHLFSVFVKEKGGDNVFCDYNVVLDVYPVKTESEKSPYLTIPSLIDIIYGYKNAKHSAFINFSGKGFVDAGKTQSLEYLVRAPFIQQTSVYTQFGGAPEKYYLSYDSDPLFVYLGDGQYAVSPLLMRTRYARGFNFKIKRDAMEGGALYLLRSESLKEQNAAGYVRFFPMDDISVSGNYAFAKGRLINSGINQKSVANTGSIFSEFTKEKTAFSLEAGLSQGIHLDESHYGKGIYAEFHCRPINDLWIDLRKIYASPNFSGFYQDTDQFTAAMGVPLFGQLRLTGSYNLYKNNLNRNPIKEAASKNQSVIGTMSAAFKNRFYAAASFNYFHSLDLLTEQSYQTRYGKLLLSKNFSKATVQASADLGEYVSGSRSNRTWQRYQFFLTYIPFSWQNYTLYARIGNQATASNINWSNVYGGTVSVNGKKAFLLMQYEWRKLSGLFANYYTLRTGYQFKNKSQISFNLLYMQRQLSENTFELMARYKIPWNLPINKERSRARLKGRVYTQEDKKSPLQGMLVNCDKQLLQTDKDGSFLFSDLTPGTHYLTFEDSLFDWVTEELTPFEMDLKGGKATTKNVVLVRPGKIYGEIQQLGFENAEVNAPSLKGKIFGEEVSGYQYITGLGGVKMQLISKDKREIIETVTDTKGRYTFDQIRPGEWTVKMNPNQVPENHYVVEAKYIVPLQASEIKSVNFTILPRKRAFKMLD